MPQGINMAKIYGRLLSTNILREKSADSFDPQRENLLGEDSICMVNLLGTSRVIVFFFLLHDYFASVFSEEHCQASMKIKTSPLLVHC